MKRIKGFAKVFAMSLCSLLTQSVMAQTLSYEPVNTKICYGSIARFKNTSKDLPPTAKIVWSINGSTPTARLQSDIFEIPLFTAGAVHVKILARDSVNPDITYGVPIDDTLKSRVILPPVFEVSASPDNTCSGKQVTFSTKQIAGEGTVDSYRWYITRTDSSKTKDTPNGTITETFYPVTDTFQIYRAGVQGVIHLGNEVCLTPKEQIKYVNVRVTDPRLKINFDMPISAICGDEGEKDIKVINRSTGKVSRWEWRLNGNQISSDSSTTIKVKTTSKIALYAYTDNNCVDSALRQVSVRDLSSSFKVYDQVNKDSIDQLWPNKSLYCPNQKLYLFANGYDTAYTSMKWAITTPTGEKLSGVGRIFKIDQSVTGTYNVTTVVSAPGECAGERTKDSSFVVEPMLNARDTLLHSCTKGTQIYSPTYNPEGTGYLWQKPVGSKAIYDDTLRYTFSTTDTGRSLNIDVLVTPVSTNGCRGKSAHVALVYEHPQAGIQINSDKKGCAPLNVTFQDATKYYTPYSNDFVTKYYWDFGNGKTDIRTDNKEFSVEYPKVGEYKYRLIVETRDGCKDTTAAVNVLCNQILVGSKPSFIGNLSKETICASDSLFLRYQGSTPYGKITYIGIKFTSSDNSKYSIPTFEKSNSCKPIDTVSLPISLKRYIDTTGNYSSTINIEYNGCRATETLKPILVKGPVIRFKDTVVCNDPLKCLLDITQQIEATDWKWAIKKKFTNTTNNTVTLVPLDSTETGQTDTTRTINFDSQFKYNKNNVDSLKKSGDYVITLYTTNNNIIVDGKACSFDYTMHEKVRDVKAAFSVRDDANEFPNRPAKVFCWNEDVTIDTALSRDVVTISWYKWKQSKADEYKMEFSIEKQDIKADSAWMASKAISKNSGNISINDTSILPGDSASLGILTVGQTDNASAVDSKDSWNERPNQGNIYNCIDTMFINAMVHRPKVRFSPLVQNYCLSATTPFSLRYKDESIFYHGNEEYVKRKWIIDTVFWKDTVRKVGTEMYRYIDGKVKMVDDIHDSIKIYYQNTITNNAIPPVTTVRCDTISRTKIISNTDRFVDTLLKLKEYRPILILQDNYGCVDSYQAKKTIRPILPDVRFEGPKHICLSSDTVAAVGKFYMRLKQGKDSLPSTNLSKVEWMIGDTSTVNGNNNTKWHRNVIGNGLSTLDSSKIAISYQFKYTNENLPIHLKTFVINPIYPTDTSKMCWHDTTVYTYSVRSIHSKIKPFLSEDTIACPPKSIEVYKVDGVDKMIWSRYVEKNNKWDVNDDGKGTFILFERNMEGMDSVRIILITDYVGCENISRSYPVRVLNNNLDNSQIFADTTSICVGDKVHFWLSEGANVTNYKNYKWYFGDGTSYKSPKPDSVTWKFDNFDTKTGGKYTVSFMLEEGDPNCGQPLPIELSVHKLVPQFDRNFDDRQIAGCIPFTVPFINNSFGEGTFTSSWDFGDNLSSTEKNPTHTFNVPNKEYKVILRVKDDSKCEVPYTKTITTYKYPQANISQLGVVCDGDTRTLAAEDTAFMKTYGWESNRFISDPSLLRLSIKPDTTTTFYFNATSGDNCSRHDSVLVKVQKRPYYIGAPHRPLIYIHEPNDTLENYARKQYELMPYVYYGLHNDSLAGVSYLWQPSTGLTCNQCASPRIMLTEDVTYTLTMVDSNRCFTVVDTVKLLAVKETKLALPSAFTPNGDGDNDRAWVRGWGIREFIDVRIYNRWGQLVYESNKIDEGWDGSYNGVAQNTDTYAYVIRAKDFTNASIFQKGYITLIR